MRQWIRKLSDVERLPLRMLVVALVYFAVTRLALLVVAWQDAVPSLFDIGRVFVIGAFYDLSFYLYALLPISLYLLLVPQSWWGKRWHRAWILVCCGLTFAGLGFIAIAEWLFWDEFQVRFNFIAVDYLVYRQEVTNNIAESYPLVPLLSLVFAQALVVAGVLRNWLYPNVVRTPGFVRRLGWTVGSGVAAVLVFLGVGQGAHQSAANAYQNELAANGPYQFFAAFRNNELDYDQMYAGLTHPQVVSTLRDDVKEPNTTWLHPNGDDIQRWVDNAGQERDLNIVLVMVESLGAEHVGYLGGKQGLTPYLDELSTQSLSFTNLYSTGTRTARGLEAVTLSIPPTPGRAIVKRIGRESGMWSLGNVLRSKGYDTRFIYGGRGYFDNMAAFFSGNGYQVMDQSTVPPEEVGFANAWGMADEYLFAQTLKAGDDAYAHHQPFFFHLMTTSNHRPYTYPDGRIDIPSGNGRDGAVKYTDWAIHDFLTKAQEHPWFDNTLFVIVADHSAGSAGKTALPVDRYHIPLLVYAPKLVTPTQVGTMASQIDIGPTLLSMLHMDYASSFFGRDILAMKPGEGRALIGNYQHLGYLQDDRLAVLSPQKKVAVQEHAEEVPLVESGSLKDPLVDDAIAYYQGASYIYRERLNAWPDTAISTNTAGAGHATMPAAARSPR